jgi:A/G-specific adenine glycosylase
VAQDIEALRTQLWNYYTEHGRHDLPWRVAEVNGQFDSYKILVSELMLQQTQVPRVISKFNEFIAAFPTFKALAAAELADVLRAWSGLGYNRRAKFLWQTAQAVAERYNGELPQTREVLMQLPGIGPNTAGAILAYAFDRPAVFVETNIRSVFIHHFFVEQEKVADKEIVAVLEQLLAAELSPREFYWALMDYGTFLKQTSGNAARRSAGYTQQSTFNGSRRQVRGKVLRALHAHAKTFAELAAEIDDERLQSVLDDLCSEGMITRQNDKYQL